MTTPVRVSRWLRRSLWLSLATHALGIAVIVIGHYWVGIAMIVSDHARYFWSSLWPHSRVFGPVLRRLETSQSELWLTIDDGPSDDTLAILDLLDVHAARATFFLVGERAAVRPQLVRAIIARGHDVGNHTQSHFATHFWRLSPARMRKQIEQAQATLTAIAGSPPHWFRAVAGMANPFVQPVLTDLGLRRVSWSVRGFDGVDADNDRVLHRLRAGLVPGAIVMLHEGGTSSVDLIRRLLQELDVRGLRAVLPGHATDRPDPQIGPASTPQVATTTRSVAARQQQPVVERGSPP